MGVSVGVGEGERREGARGQMYIAFEQIMNVRKRMRERERE